MLNWPQIISLPEKRWPAGRLPLPAIGFPGLLSLLFLIMTWWSWRKWPDILVDFGRELYMPWQIANGRLFYRDIAHLFGPFSVHLNALLFKAFGVSYTVVFFSNLVILAGMLAIVYHFLQQACSRVTAFSACAFIILVFAFSQYVPVGNYNFVSPYSHEATHGTVLAVLTIHQLWRFSIDGSRKNLYLAAVAFGCVFLTKAEIFAAICLAVASFFGLMRFDPQRPDHLGISAARFVLIALVPVAVFGIYFGVQMSPGAALSALLFPYSILLDSDLPDTLFYREGMGLDNISRNAVDMFSQALFILVSIASAAGFSRWHQKNLDRPLVRTLCTIGLIGTAAAALLVSPLTAGFPLPVLTSVSLAMVLVSYLRSASAGDKQKSHLLALVAWAVFSLALLGKIVLNAIVYHYGFYLSMPAVVLLIVMGTWFLPEWLDRKHAGGDTLQKVMLIMLAVIAGQFLSLGNQFYRLKHLPIGKGGDRMVTYNRKIDSRGPVMKQTLSWLDAHVGEDETIAAVPEGIILNYLGRKINPTRYTNLMPPEVTVFGENAILEDLKTNPPDYCLIVHNHPAGYGVDFFGKDPRYGQRIMRWIKRNYHSVHLAGNEPLKGDRFGIRILQHNRTDR